MHVNTKCKLKSLLAVHLWFDHPKQILISVINGARVFFLFHFPSFIGSHFLSHFLMFSLVQALLLTFLATVFRCRCFITQPCFTWACAQKQCDRPWHRSIISCSQTKGWVMHVFSWEHPGDSLQGWVSCHPLYHSPFISPLRHGNRVYSALEYTVYGDRFIGLTKHFPWPGCFPFASVFMHRATLKSYT